MLEGYLSVVAPETMNNTTRRFWPCSHEQAKKWLLKHNFEIKNQTKVSIHAERSTGDEVLYDATFRMFDTSDLIGDQVGKLPEKF
jgi:hypothetical protein